MEHRERERQRRAGGWCDKECTETQSHAVCLSSLSVVFFISTKSVSNIGRTVNGKCFAPGKRTLAGRELFVQ